ncbi:hypothetical protein OVY29_19385 [Sphingopyxis sp. SE2]|nr:hypothetical protein [Sphingopyxis sp. SE2]KGB57915.1 hypothetical protein FG95_01528 [Sphingopyxis sp. LC363]MDT7530829.1 hypothetical protein [Sphingopyxis sp. SE2]
MNMRNLLFPVTSLALALAACSQPSQTETAPTGSADNAKAAEAPPPIKPTDVPTRGGDGSPIELAMLTEADVSGAKLKGELACSFADDEGAQPILLAQGDVASEEPSRGIVKVGDSIETVSANGGFDAMAKGTKFYAKGLELRVALTGLAQGEGESPPRPATLTADRADGARRVFAGLWQCGP